MATTSGLYFVNFAENPIYTGHMVPSTCINNAPTNLLSGQTTSVGVTCRSSYTVSRRGRRPTMPPEQREQTRRLKKQNMERRRRTCISDKMNALHSLAMNIIGVEPQQQQKMEKADILSVCHKVFEGVAKIVEDEPKLRSRFHQLRSQFRLDTPSKMSASGVQRNETFEETKSHAHVRLPGYLDNKENLKPTPSHLPIQSQASAHSVQSSRTQIATQETWHSTPFPTSNEFPHTRIPTDRTSESGIQLSWDSPMDSVHRPSMQQFGSPVGNMIRWTRESSYDSEGVPTRTGVFRSVRRPLQPINLLNTVNVQTTTSGINASVKTALNAAPTSAFTAVQKCSSSHSSASSSVWRPYI